MNPYESDTLTAPRGKPPVGAYVLLPPASAGRWIILALIATSAIFFHGFLVPVLAALVIGFATWPIYRRLLNAMGQNRTLAASAMISVVVILVIAPIVIAILYAIAEVQTLGAWLIAANQNGAPPPAWFATTPVIGEWLVENWQSFLGTPGMLAQVAESIGSENISGIYATLLSLGVNTIGTALNLLFMVVTLLFVYRNGASFAADLDLFGERIFPGKWDRLSRIVPASVSATVSGMTLIAIGEGVVLGVAYWIAGAPSPVTLGIVTGLAAMIPGGAPLSFTAVSLYLIASGSPVAGLALFAWGSIELFIVDKTIRPKLVGGPIKLPFLPTFFGLIGGVKTMGLVGLFAGPVLMALLVSLWREAVRDLKTTSAPLPVPDTQTEQP